ncbi:MAG: carboxylesterase family protein [Eubacterium sp.]
MENNVVIDTECGKIRGLSFDYHNEFRGVKYATARRWEYSQQVTSWEGIYDATGFGACSFQRRSFEDDAKCNPFYHKEFRQGMTFEYSEDCLFLNIWAPKNAENCPVLVYIHGGSFTGGSADEGHISGAEYAKNGVLFVAMNYRLGPYGFCSHPDLKDEDGACGNYGLYDQYIAIKWVRDNISHFGGDNKKITLMGQSAGAMSVDIQLSNPMCRGWFSGAVLMSGAAIQRSVVRPLPAEKTVDFWQQVMAAAGVDNIEALRQVDVKTLFYAWFGEYSKEFMNILYSLPTVDGRIIAEHNFDMTTIPDIPYVVGVTTADMAPVALEILAQRYAVRCKGHKNPCYIYNFDRQLPGDDVGAWHCSDLPYAFATLMKGWRPYEDVDYEISNQMLKSLVAFCGNGDPNCNAIPSIWHDGAKCPMRFCESTRSMHWPTPKLLKNTIFNKGPI